MDMNQMQELAKAAAHSAVTARYQDNHAFNLEQPVNDFLIAYEYALKQIFEKHQQVQNDVNMEFGSNKSKFR